TVSTIFSIFTVTLVHKLSTAELALKTANAKLDQRVQERTAEFVAANQNLRAEIEMRTNIEQRLVSLLEEKKKLHKEINHRVKNNLQIVASLLNLQASMLADEKVRTILQDSQSRIRSLALIHEKLYQSGNMAQINFGEYVKDLTAYLLRVHQHRAEDISLTVDDIWLDVDTAVSLGLIINELTSNAIEHAFPGGQIGTIRVSVRKTNPQTLELVISDNGVGLPPQITPETESTLGLQLVGSLVNQLNGFLNISRKDGTSIKIGVPVEEHHHE
ncbi:MAG: sensor histidine kinase, partial [Chloroflexi bacterium]